MSLALQILQDFVERGGPEDDEYSTLTACWAAIAALSRPEHGPAPWVEQTRTVLAPTLTRSTMQGFAFLKPYGYAGDFETTERIYAGWLIPDTNLVRWDKYFHAQPAPQAVRNRKHYFQTLLARWDTPSRRHAHRGAECGQRPGPRPSRLLGLRPTRFETNLHIH
jgi:hypothetical protein